MIEMGHHAVYRMYSTLITSKAKSLGQVEYKMRPTVCGIGDSTSVFESEQSLVLALASSA